MKNYSIIITAVTMLLLVALARSCDEGKKIEYEYIHDTTVIKAPVQYEKVLVDNPRTVYVRVKEEAVDISEDDSVYTLEADTRHYKDSLYEAWVSGIDPVLDSIKVYNKTVIKTVTRTVPEYKYITLQPTQKKVQLGGFIGGQSSFDLNHIDLQGGVELSIKNLSVKGGYNLGRDNSYPFVGIEYKLR